MATTITIRKSWNHHPSTSSSSSSSSGRCCGERKSHLPLHFHHNDDEDKEQNYYLLDSHNNRTMKCLTDSSNIAGTKDNIHRKTQPKVLETPFDPKMKTITKKNRIYMNMNKFFLEVDCVMRNMSIFLCMMTIFLSMDTYTTVALSSSSSSSSPFSSSSPSSFTNTAATKNKNNHNHALELLNTARLLREKRNHNNSGFFGTTSEGRSNKAQVQQRPSTTTTTTTSQSMNSRKTVPFTSNVDSSSSSSSSSSLSNLALEELTSRSRIRSNSKSKEYTIQQKMTSSSLSSSSSWSKALFDDYDYNNDGDNNNGCGGDTLFQTLVPQKDEEEFISNRVQTQLPHVKSLLKTSYGNDVPDIELHLQMEAARARGKKEGGSVAALAFMELHHEMTYGGLTTMTESNTSKTTIGRDRRRKGRSASRSRTSSTQGVSSKETFSNPTRRKATTAVSTIEKVAMSSLPSQLPGLAAPVLNGHSGGRRDSLPSTTSTTSSVSGTTQTKTQNLDETHHTSKRAVQPKRGSARRKKSLDGSVKKEMKDDGSKSSVDYDSAMSSNKANSLNFSSSTVKKIKSRDVSNIMSVRKTLHDAYSSSSSPTARVSHDEEIALARIIQRGSELHRLKTKFEQEHMRDISRTEWMEIAKLESPKELRRLVSDYRKAKNKLVMANMGLVHAVVRTRMRESGRGSVSYDGVSYEEMVQEGSLGLLRAAELFDPSRGLRFSTYATIWIKGVLGNSSLSEAITLPLREKNKWRKIQTAVEEISAQRGVDKNGAQYKPTEEEIASQCGIKAAEIKTIMMKMKRTKNVLSLDYQYDSQTRSGVENGQFEALSNDKNMMDDVDLVEKLQLRADVVAALTKNLDPREARLMRLRYGLNDGKTRSIRDCAEAMGISKARAQQLAVGCLKKLREADDAESLQEYLLSVA